MWWLLIFIGAALIVAGLLVHVFKQYNLIAGYNTMSEEKKAKVDTKGLGRMMGIYFYINGGVFIVVGLLDVFGLELGIVPPLVLLSVSTIYFLIRAQKYDGNVYDERGKLRPGAWKQLLSVAGVTVIVTFGIFALLFFSSRPAKITLLNEGIRIHSAYGKIYQWDSIDSVELKQTLPTITLRTNGSAVGSILKGYFKTREFGVIKLFVDSKIPWFIYLKSDDEITVFNLETAEKTLKFYNDILQYVK